MFSGLVWVGMLTAFGRATGTVLVITGIVMRKMMSSTSITSTSGVVLIVAMTLGSSPPETGPTLIAIFALLSSLGARRLGRTPGEPEVLLAQRRRRRCRRTGTTHLVAADACAADEIGMQIAREVPQSILRGLERRANMAMSVGPVSGGEEPSVMATINTTPLVDVML